MASVDDDLELDVSGSEEKKSGGAMKWVIIIVVALALVGGGVTAAMLLMGDDEPADEQSEMVATESSAGSADGAEQPAKEVKKKKKKQKRKGTPNFMDMTPAFVVNLNDTASDVKFLQVSVSLMSYSKEDIDKVREYTPLIKNQLVLLFSEQKFKELRTKVGKEKLQAEALSTVQQALEEMTGSELIDALYITSIVGQ